MLWLFPRVLVLCFALIVICGGGVAVGRLDHTPDALQELGFDVCDGEPCYLGVRLGMDLTPLRAQYPQTVKRKNLSYVSPDNTTRAEFWSDDGITVEAVVIIHIAHESSPTLATLIARYGPPSIAQLHFMELSGRYDVPFMMRLIYPSFLVDVNFDFLDRVNRQYVHADYRLQSNLPISAIHILPNNVNLEYCNYFSSPIVCGPWYGFASVETYRARVQQIRRTNQH